VSDYVNGSIGVIRGNTGGYGTRPDVASFSAPDMAVFSFHDHEGSLRALLRSRSSGLEDSVWIYDPSNFRKPILNRKGFGSNIHAAASSGRYLYLATYESYPDSGNDEDSGEVVRVDMQNNYAADAKYRHPMFNGPTVGHGARPHGEGVTVHNGKVYVMFGISDYTKVLDYEPTEILEFEPDLTPTGRVARLEEGAGIVGKNSLSMAMYGGKLYVGCVGGPQGLEAGSVSDGGVWEVDLDAMTARRVLDGGDITPRLPDGANWGVYGVSFAEDGTAFILTGGFDSEWKFYGKLFKTTATNLTGPDAAGSLTEMYSFGQRGNSWGMTYDDVSETLWCMGGTALFAFDKNGGHVKTFQPIELGGNIYSVALFNELPSQGSGAATAAADPPVPADQNLKSGVSAVQRDYVTVIKAGDGENLEDVLSDLKTNDGLPPALDIGDLEKIFQINSATKELEVNSVAMRKGMDGATAQAVSQKDVLPLAVFHAAVEPRGTALITTTIDLSGFAGASAAKLALLKMKYNGRDTVRLKRVNGFSDMADGTYIITDSDGSPLSGTIQPAGDYLISIAIRDNGDYDWCREIGEIVDPRAKATLNDSDDDAGGSEGMPGGCATGAGGCAALAALAMIFYGRKRG
jgi:hypothetical protein